jgi:hypothetical protein
LPLMAMLSSPSVPLTTTLSTTPSGAQQGHTCVIVAPSALPGGRLVDLAASRNV